MVDCTKRGHLTRDLKFSEWKGKSASQYNENEVFVTKTSKYEARSQSPNAVISMQCSFFVKASRRNSVCVSNQTDMLESLARIVILFWEIFGF